MDAREPQRQALQALIQIKSPCILVHGRKSSGKTRTINQCLKSTNHTIVAGDQCATKRALLSRAFKGILHDSGVQDEILRQISTKELASGELVATSDEYMTGFTANLATYFRIANYTRVHVLVLERISEVGDLDTRSASETLLPALARIRECSELQNLVVILVLDTVLPRSLATMALPTVHFGPYTRDQAVDIVVETCGLTGTVVRPFCAAIADTYADVAGTNVRVLTDIVLKLWPRFSQPLETSSDLDFVRLLRMKPDIFDDCPVTYGFNATSDAEPEPEKASGLPPLARYAVCASYLASYLPPKYDLRMFSKLKEARTGMRKRTKVAINPRDLSPNAFEVERMLMILTVLHESVTGQPPDRSIDLSLLVATLASMQILTKSGDAIDPKTRWKVNVDFTTVQRMAAQLDLNIEDFLMD